MPKATEKICSDPQSLETKLATPCQDPRWPRSRSDLLLEASQALPGRDCASRLPYSHPETSAVPRGRHCFSRDTVFQSLPRSSQAGGPRGCAVTEGLGLGAGEGPQPLGSSCFQRHRVLIGRPASPPAAQPRQPRAGRVSGLEAGNCWRQEGKTDCSGFTGKE